MDELQGKPVTIAGLGVTTAPGTPMIRIFWDPTPAVHNPKATYKVLVNGQTNGFRHEHVPDSEALVQNLGAENGFDVDIWDNPTGPGSPGRAIPAGVTLKTSPFLDLNTLKQYKTIVFDSSVGRDPQASLNAAEFANHDELYNQSRNPTELGIVHPLVLENEATMIGQINASLGPLLNSDKHAMVYCRNFEGGRSFTTLLGHSWQLMHDEWYQQMLLKGIQTTAGVDGGAALKRLNEKGLELISWMKGL